MNLTRKCIFKKFKTFEEFWAQAQTVFLLPTARTLTDRINAYFFAYKVYDYWKLNWYLGEEETFFGKFFTELATKFYQLSKRESVYLKIFPNLHTWTNLLNIRTSEYDNITDFVDKIISQVEGQKVNTAGGLGKQEDFPDDPYKAKIEWLKQNINRQRGLVSIETKQQLETNLTNTEKELETLKEQKLAETDANKQQALDKTIELKEGQIQSLKDKIVYWTEKGITSQESLNPNWTKERGITNRKTGNRTIDTKQQRNQQIGKVLQAFNNLEVDLLGYIQSFSHLFDSWAETSFSLNEVVACAVEGKEFKYITRKAIEEQEEIQQQAQKDTEIEEISQETYNKLKNEGKPVEKTWYLECLVRQKQRLEKQLKKGSSPATKENTERCLEGVNKLIDIFFEDIKDSSLEHYDKVMAKITGFKELKQELRDRLEIASYYKRIGKKLPQVFYCLVGKPGVGKTEIVKQIAKAYQRQLEIIGMAGLTDPAILNGRERAYKSSRWGRIMDAFVERNAQMTIKLTDLEADLTKLQAKTVKTELEKQKQQELTEEIKKWKEAKDTERKVDKASQSAIILLDESEKAKDESVLFVVGQLTDRGLNFDFYDKFFEYRLDLSSALIFLTANYPDRVPDFIQSRCKFVNIPLLTYAERLEILENKKKDFIRDYFPADDPKIDAYNSENGFLTKKQRKVAEKIGEKFLKCCITEEFGVRGAIMNLISAVDFFVLLEVRGILKDLVSLDNYSREEDEEKVHNLYYQIEDKEYLLSLTKKRDIEWVKEKSKEQGKAESVLNLVADWPNYNAKWKPN